MLYLNVDHFFDVLLLYTSSTFEGLVQL